METVVQSPFGPDLPIQGAMEPIFIARIRRDCITSFAEVKFAPVNMLWISTTSWIFVHDFLNTTMRILNG